MRVLKIVTIIILFLTPATAVFADGSIYSLRGLGMMYYFAGGRGTAMGGATIAVNRIGNLNWVNPAALTILDHVRLSSQFLFQNTKTNNSTEQFRTNYANFNGFIAAFAAHSRVGISFALQPITKINYQFDDTGQIDEYEYTRSVKSSGGLNRLSLSTGIKLHPRISIGADLGFVFGKADEDYRNTFVSQQLLNTHDQLRSKYWGFNYQLGFIAAVISGWNIGAIYQNQYKLNKTLDKKFYTPQITESSSSDLTLPGKWGVGTSVFFAKRYLLALDYLYQDWQNYKEDNVRIGKNDFTQYQRLSFGFEYGLTYTSTSGFWQRVRYRFGLAWEQSYFLDYDDNKIGSYIVSGGFGIPFSSGGGAMDVALEYVKRGELPNNSFKESVFRLSIYIAGGERWFQR